ncbi:MAG: hypothetical protein Q7R58_02355 [bacterium]|nr:hypothetical protein [bacterium]
MKYSKLNLGQIEALVNKVGGLDGVSKILSGRVGIVPLKPWQTIRLGNFQSEDALRQALDNAGSDGGYEDGSGKSSLAIKSVELSRPQSVDLVIVAVEDLGLPDSHTMEEIYAAANDLGLDYCPDETAAQVLLQCDVGSTGIHRLQFAMDPSRRSGNGFRISEHKGKNYLGRFSNSLRYTRSGYEKFVFVLRK